MFFISPKKLSLFWRYLNFCSDFFGHVGKRLDKKTKINIKIYDNTTWKTNSYNTHIAQLQYLRIYYIFSDLKKGKLC